MLAPDALNRLGRANRRQVCVCVKILMGAERLAAR